MICRRAASAGLSLPREQNSRRPFAPFHSAIRGDRRAGHAGGLVRAAADGALGHRPLCRTHDLLVLRRQLHLGRKPLFHLRCQPRARPLCAAKEGLRFLAANAVGGLVNVGLYSVLVRFAPPPFNDLTVALVLGVLLGLVFNFTLSKKVVFKGPI